MFQPKHTLLPLASQKIEPTSMSQMDILRYQPSVSNNIQKGILQHKWSHNLFFSKNFGSILHMFKPEHTLLPLASQKIEPTSRSQMDILRCQPSVSNNIQNGISLRRHRGKRSCCCSQCAVSSWLQTKGKLVQALCVRLLLLFLSDWHWSQCHFQVVLRFWLRNLFRQKVWKMTFDYFWLMIMSILASSACTALKQHGLKEGGLCQIFRADLIPSWDFTSWIYIY